MRQMGRLKNTDKYNSAIFISAAGKGTRMNTLTKNTPKALLNLYGQPMVDYICKYISDKNIFNRAIISYGYCRDKWQEFIIRYKDCIDFLDYSLNPDIIYSFMDSIKKINEEHILFINCDTIFDFEIIEDILKKHIEHNNDLTILLNKSNNYSYKKWDYILDGDSLIDIRKEKRKTNIEKYFFIVKKSILSDFTKEFTVNLGNSEEDIYNFDEFNNGCTCLIKSILDHRRYSVKVSFLAQKMFNINNKEILLKAKKYIKENHLA